MIRVEKVACADSRDVEALLTNSWRRGDQVKWHKLFEYQWGRDESYCGLALKDEDKVVGFIGMIFSQRSIDEKVEKFCNLAAWFVREEYRGRAIALLFPLFSMRDYTITDYTPAKKVYRIQNKLGLKDLEAKGRILLPIGRRLFQPKYTSLKMTHDLAAIEKKLDGQNRTIFHDHKPYQCFHFLATEETRHCYIIYTKLKRKRPYAHIHYISNPDLFELVYRDIRQEILSHSNTYFLLIDSRLVNKRRLPISFCLPYKRPKQYLSSRLEPEQIDNLYSELVVLNLRTLPRLKYLLRDIRRKLVGSIKAV